MPEQEKQKYLSELNTEQGLSLELINKLEARLSDVTEFTPTKEITGEAFAAPSDSHLRNRVRDQRNINLRLRDLIEAVAL